MIDPHDDPQLAAQAAGVSELPPDPAEQPFEPTPTIAGDRPNRPEGLPPDDLTALVQGWWNRTDKTPSFEKLCRQVDRDVATIDGMELGSRAPDEQAQTEDRLSTTSRHVYRNTLTSMALVFPENPEVEIQPAPLMPAFGENGQAIPDSDGHDTQTIAFAKALDLLQAHFAREAHAVQTIKGCVQDGHHFEWAWLKITWQRDYREDVLQEERLPDIQDLIAEAETLNEQYALGEFTDRDEEYRRLGDLVKTIAMQTAMPVWRGPMIKSVPAKMMRMDQGVLRTEDWREADWISQDFLMTRREVLMRFRSIDPQHLFNSPTYTIDGKKQGNDVRAESPQAANQPTNATAVGTRQGGANANEHDLLLVREVSSKRDQEIIVLVEGLDYPARKWRPERTPPQWFFFELLVINRKPGVEGPVGYSDTELQAKDQDKLNRIDTEEEEAVQAAMPKGIYDKDLIPDDLTDGLRKLRAHGLLGVQFNGKDLAAAFRDMPGSNQINPALFQNRRAMALQRMRTMSGLPEQMSGGMGSADFAKEVAVAEEGAAVMTQNRRNTVADFLTGAWQTLCFLIVQEVTLEEAVELIGPNVEPFWHPEVQNREAIFRKLHVRVKASLTGKPGKREIVEGMKLFVDTAVILSTKPSGLVPEKVLSEIARAIELPCDVDQLFDEDENALAMRLAAAVAKDPTGLDPAVLQQLAQILMPLIQQDIQAQAAAAAGGGGAPGDPAAPGGGAPPGAPGPGGLPAPPPEAIPPDQGAPAHPEDIFAGAPA